MMVEVHAIVLALVLPASLAAAHVWRRRAGADGLSWRDGLGAAVAVIACFVAFAASVHMCARGQATNQAVVCSLAALLAVGYVGDRAGRWTLGTVLALVTLGLCFQYAALVHGGFIGDPAGLELGEGAARALWHTWLTGLYEVAPSAAGS